MPVGTPCMGLPMSASVAEKAGAIPMVFSKWSGLRQDAAKRLACSPVVWEQLRAMAATREPLAELQQVGASLNAQVLGLS